MQIKSTARSYNTSMRMASTNPFLHTRDKSSPFIHCGRTKRLAASNKHTHTSQQSCFCVYSKDLEIYAHPWMRIAVLFMIQNLEATRDRLRPVQGMGFYSANCSLTYTQINKPMQILKKLSWIEMYISFNKIRIFVSNNKHLFSSETQKIALSEQGFNFASHHLHMQAVPPVS